MAWCGTPVRMGATPLGLVIFWDRFPRVARGAGNPGLEGAEPLRGSLDHARKEARPRRGRSPTWAPRRSDCEHLSFALFPLDLCHQGAQALPTAALACRFSPIPWRDGAISAVSLWHPLRGCEPFDASEAFASLPRPSDVRNPGGFGRDARSLNGVAPRRARRTRRNTNPLAFVTFVTLVTFVVDPRVVHGLNTCPIFGKPDYP